MFGGGGKADGKQEEKETKKKEERKTGEEEPQEGEWGNICFDDQEIEIILVDNLMEEGEESVFEEEKPKKEGNSLRLSSSSPTISQLNRRPLSPRPTSPTPSPPEVLSVVPSSVSPSPAIYSPSAGEVRPRKRERKKRVDSMVVRSGVINETKK